MSGVEQRVEVEVTVNGRRRAMVAEPRATLAEVLRVELGLTGTHLGCEHGVCGACTVLVDGASARSCLLFAWQVDGRAVVTIEGLAGDATMGPLQQACVDAHSFQCGFCTPGMLATATELLAASPDPTAAEVRDALSGNLCRCTGYDSIVAGVLLAAERIAGRTPAGSLPPHEAAATAPAGAVPGAPADAAVPTGTSATHGSAAMPDAAVPKGASAMTPAAGAAPATDAAAPTDTPAMRGSPAVLDAAVPTARAGAVPGAPAVPDAAVPTDTPAASPSKAVPHAGTSPRGTTVPGGDG